jgi:exodeoxyribonuclease-3
VKVVSYNVNGIRAAIKKGLLDWLAEEKDIDVFCVQETKAQIEQLDSKAFEDLGYHISWHQAVKKGYSGVATFSKVKPDLVKVGIDIEKYDSEGRVLRTDIGDTTILNCYFPSGSSSEERHGFKMDFLYDFKPVVDKLLKTRKKVIVVGDYNVVHQEIDIHNPQRKDNPSGFRPEERAWMTEWFENGFVDAYRNCYPEEQAFSWWSYRAGSRQRNKGWRIDYISVSDKLSQKIQDAGHFNEAKHSDHCPVWVQL